MSAAVGVEPGLVTAAQQGDLGAWEQIVRRYQEPIFRATFLLTRGTSIAEAATEAAFIRAYRALPQLDADAPLAPWLMRIAIGEARQKRRDAGRTRSSARPDEPVVGPHFPSSPVAGLANASEMTPLERDTIVDAFDRLADDDRLVIASRYLFGLSREDSAAALAIPVALVEARLRDAIARLRKRMGVVP